MARIIKTEAIVLKKYSLPNQDRIITLFTKEIGKVSVVAKGIKKITSRRLPHAETANLINVSLSISKERFYFADSTLLSGFTSIKAESRKTAFLYYFFFILTRILPEHQPEPAIYQLTMRFLIKLSGLSRPNDFPLVRYMNTLLNDLGYTEENSSFESLQRSIEEIIHEKLPPLSI